MTRPSESHRSALAKLFPASTSGKPNTGSSSLDPTSDLVTRHQKAKKKSTRIKPFRRSVVVLDAYSHTIPSAGTRKQLSDNGRMKKLEFRRNMTHSEVKNVIVRNFPCLAMNTGKFLKCAPGNTLEEFELEGRYPNGELLLTVASKESVYMVEVSVVLIIKPWCEFVILIFRILMTLNHLQGGGSSKGKWKKSLTHLMMTLSSPTGRSQLSKELEIV